jgi:hypothetical protein
MNRELPPPARGFLFLASVLQKPFAGGGANGFCTLASAERRVQRSGTGFSVVVSVSGCGVEVRVCFQASLLACWLGDGWGSWVRGSDLIGVGG